MFEKIKTFITLWKVKRGMKRFIENPRKFIEFDDGKEPTLDEIKRYYKMYVQKIENEAKTDEWTTKVKKPISFEEYKVNALKEGKVYLFRSKATMFMFDPKTGTSTYI